MQRLEDNLIIEISLLTDRKSRAIGSSTWSVLLSVSDEIDGS